MAPFAGIGRLISSILGQPEYDEGSQPVDVSGEELGGDTGGWTENIPGGGTSANPPISGGTVQHRTGNPVLDAVLNLPRGAQPTPKLRPVDYLSMIATPGLQGLVTALQSRPTDRRLGFWTGMAQGALGDVAHIAQRPQQIAQAQRDRAIEDILLATKVRGTRPVVTGTGWRWPGTGEQIEGGPPAGKPPAERNVQTREVTLPSGDTQVEEYDPANRVWKPAMTEEQQTDETGQKRSVRVPLVSKQKPSTREPIHTWQWGKDGDLYYIEQGKDAQKVTGIKRDKRDLPEREGDIRRQERAYTNSTALRYLQDAPGNTPEEKVNNAVSQFTKDAAQNKNYRSYADDITNSIRTIGKTVKSQDELTALITSLLRGGAAPKAQGQP